MYKVMGDMIELSTGNDPKPIALTYELDEDMIGMVTNFTNFLLTIYLDMYDQLFTVDISNHKEKEAIKPHIDQLHEYALICHEALRSHNANKYWRQTAVDVENIFELIKAMDANDKLDWKNTWKYIVQAQ